MRLRVNGALALGSPGTFTALTNGQVAFVYSELTAGNETLTVDYLGDNNYKAVANGGSHVVHCS